MADTATEMRQKCRMVDCC